LKSGKIVDLSESVIEFGVENYPFVSALQDKKRKKKVYENSTDQEAQPATLSISISCGAHKLVRTPWVTKKN
jgi:hypothetical protein